MSRFSKADSWFSGLMTGPGRAKTTWRGRFRLVVVLTIGLLSGCSLSLVYPRLDILAAWQLDRYLRLDAGQEDWLDARLEERLAWHQREQLPQWRQALSAVRADIAEQRLDTERYQFYNSQIRALLAATIGGLVDDSIELASVLTDTQVAYLFRHFDEETDELKEELAETAADPDKQQEDRYDNTLENAKDWLGPLSTEQRDYLKQWSARALNWDDFALESRVRWRAHVEQTLAVRSNPELLNQYVRQMLLHSESLRSPSYQLAVDQQAEHRQAMHLYLLQTLSEKQRQHLLGELDDLIEDLDDLIAG